MVDQIFEGRLRSVSEDDMAGLYLQMIGSYGERFAQLVAIAADVDHLPMLFHCTAGKDRSGIASALLLEALGVARETVLDDYCLTNELRSHQRMAELAPEFAKINIDINEVRAILSAPRGVMATVLAEIDDRFGRLSNGTEATGVEGYLLAHGLDPAALEMLRANLLI